MKSNEYKCAACRNVYEKGRSDKDAKEELKEIWGEIPQEDCVVICDNCFNLLKRAESIDYEYAIKYLTQ